MTDRRTWNVKLSPAILKSSISVLLIFVAAFMGEVQANTSPSTSDPRSCAVAIRGNETTTIVKHLEEKWLDYQQVAARFFDSKAFIKSAAFRYVIVWAAFIAPGQPFSSVSDLKKIEEFSIYLQDNRNAEATVERVLETSIRMFDLNTANQYDSVMKSLEIPLNELLQAGDFIRNLKSDARLRDRLFNFLVYIAPTYFPLVVSQEGLRAELNARIRHPYKWWKSNNGPQVTFLSAAVSFLISVTFQVGPTSELSELFKIIIPPLGVAAVASVRPTLLIRLWWYQRQLSRQLTNALAPTKEKLAEISFVGQSLPSSTIALSPYQLHSVFGAKDENGNWHEVVAIRNNFNRETIGSFGLDVHRALQEITQKAQQIYDASLSSRELKQADNMKKVVGESPFGSTMTHWEAVLSDLLALEKYSSALLEAGARSLSERLKTLESLPTQGLEVRETADFAARAEFFKDRLEQIKVTQIIIRNWIGFIENDLRMLSELHLTWSSDSGVPMPNPGEQSINGDKKAL